mmetsp:Transcript_36032/g.74093  ORF Transcript_36032/g.74093 Transcript_36032/m.74093 type:complete len:80 (-) Transcript_36032:224-463(-)
MNLKTAVDIEEIFKSSKTSHFKNIHKATGIPYSDMIFFDNEEHNCRNVAPLGVTCVYTPRGMTEAEWDRGLKLWSKNQS